MGAYPSGCTQAMHDRAFADEDREPCQTCDGTAVDCPYDIPNCPYCVCQNCNGTGYEPRSDTREDDAYDEVRDADIKF